MTVFAAFRTTENLFLVLFALVILAPAVIAVWAWWRYPDVASWSAAVFGNFVILVTPPLLIWLESSYFLFLVAICLIVPLIVAIRAWRRYPSVSEYSGAVVTVLAFLVVMTLNLMAGVANLRIGKVKLFLSPGASFDFLMFSSLIYLGLFPLYLVLSIVLLNGILSARKLQRLAK